MALFLVGIGGLRNDGCQLRLEKAFQKIPAVRNFNIFTVQEKATFIIDVNAIPFSVNATAFDAVFDDLPNHTGYNIEIFDERLCGTLRTKDSITLAPIKLEYPFDENEPTVGSTQLAKTSVLAFSDCYSNEVILRYQQEVRQLPWLSDRRHKFEARQALRLSLFGLLVGLLAVSTSLEDLLKGGLKYVDHLKWWSLISATAIQIIVNWRFGIGAVKSLLHLRYVGMDFVVVLSTSIAYCRSLVGLRHRGFGAELSKCASLWPNINIASQIFTALMANDVICRRAAKYFSYRDLQPRTVHILTDNRSQGKEEDARALLVGDAFRVPPYHMIATDGLVLSGGSEVDESKVIGGSKSVAKAVDSRVVAGSRNLGGSLDVKVTETINENTIGRTASLLDIAESLQLELQAIANRIAGHLSLGGIGISIAVFLSWLVNGVCLKQEPWWTAIFWGLEHAMATLTVVCPPAFGLAIPMVVESARNLAIRRGIVFRAANAMDRVRKARHIVFSTSAILLFGKFRVSKNFFISQSKHTTLSQLVGLFSSIDHPALKKIASELFPGQIDTVVFDKTSLNHDGYAEGHRGDERIRCGDPIPLGFAQHPMVQDIKAKFLTPFVVVRGQTLVAVLGLDDKVRKESLQEIRDLQADGITTSVLLGDNLFRMDGLDGFRNNRGSLIYALWSSTPSTNPAGQHDCVVVLSATEDFHELSSHQLTIRWFGKEHNIGRPPDHIRIDIMLVRGCRGIACAIRIARGCYKRAAFCFVWAAVYHTLALLIASGALSPLGLRAPPEFVGLALPLNSVVMIVVVSLWRLR